MLTDVDLNAPTSGSGWEDATPAVDPSGAASVSANTNSRHYSSSQPLAPSSSKNNNTNTNTNTNNARRTTTMLRGRRSYNFTMKRPRRHVAKRSIQSLPLNQMEQIEEEKEMLLGMDMVNGGGNNRRGGGGGGGDTNDGSSSSSFKASKIAMGLFLVVCSLGGYRGLNEYVSMRKQQSRSSAFSRISEMVGMGSSSGPGENDDVTKSFRGSSASSTNEEDRELIEEANNNSQGDTTSSTEEDQNQNQQPNIEDIPTILFDVTIIAPPQLSNLVNVWEESYNPDTTNKLFFWHIPRSGSTSITRIASYCLGLTIASEAGKAEAAIVGSTTNNGLRIVEGLDGMRFANVDMSHPKGIEQAQSLQIGSSPYVDLVSSPYLWESAGVFDVNRKGYMVAMIRHPIERAVSLYYSMRKNPMYEKSVGPLHSIEQYAKSSLVENNWMTRFLSNALSGELTPEHEAIAKEVLRTKCIIGLLKDKTETMRRFEYLFAHKAKERSQRREECVEKLLFWDWPGKNRHTAVERGSEAWDMLYKQNSFDLRLFEYAQQLFVAQGKLFDGSGSTVITRQVEQMQVLQQPLPVA